MPKMKNAAAGTIPQPAPPRQTTINHQAAPWGEILIIGFCILILVIVLGWRGLVFLFDEAGYQRPSEAVADMILVLILAALVLPVAILIGRHVVAKICELGRDVAREFMRTQVKLAQIRHNADHALLPQSATRMNEQDRQFSHVVIEVMRRAYKCIDEHGRLMTYYQPWSSRQAGTIIPPGKTKEIGRGNLANRVAPFLLEHNVLVDERTINVRDYPPDTGVARIRELLEEKFGPAIQISGGVGMTNPYVQR